jgi:hypothetical protein
MDPYFVVNSYSNNEFVTSSDVFHNKSDALYFKYFLDSTNMLENKVVYCMVLNEKQESLLEDDIEKRMEENLEMFEGYDMILKIFNYGSGYFLKCPEDNPYYGMVKYEDGIWDSSLGGWVFDEHCDIDKLSNLGMFTNIEFEFDCEVVNEPTECKKYNLRKRT